MSDDYNDRADAIVREIEDTRKMRKVKPVAELSEDALALSFCEVEPLLRYVATWNRWLSWTGTAWREDDTLGVYDRVRSHIRRVTDADPDWMKAGTVAAIERMAKADRRYAATQDQWDADPWLLNTPEGIIDLQTGRLLPSDPDVHLTKLTAVGPGGDCPAWRQFLEQVTGGDQEYIAFLQRVAGYAATGSIREHALFFCYGPGGNGKGTLLNTLKRILGDYATVAGMETFVESQSDRHPTDLAFLRGARMVLAQETEEGRAWAESRIKALTGGDPVTARYMRADFFTYEPTFKLLIAGNHKPRLRNVDEAMRRRLYLLPFTRQFAGEACDPDLADKLIEEAPGILQWVVDGALNYQREGLNPPAVVTAATADYFAAENLFEQWLTDCCERGPEHWEPPSRLFASWKRYADAANVKPGNQNSFAERLDCAGFPGGNSRAKGGRYREGLRLIPEPAPEDWHQ